MLKEFRITNYKSINEETIFSLEAAPTKEVSEFPNHVINYKNERLLKISSFYGPNGGGKSNLLLAFHTMISIILNEDIKNLSYGDNPSLSCAFSSSPLSKFEIFLITANYEIGYSLSVDLTKTKERKDFQNNLNRISLVDYQIDNEEFVFRKLNEKDFETVFIRNNKGIVNSKYLKNIDLIKNKIPLAGSTSFLYYFDTSIGKGGNALFQPLYEFINDIKGVTFLNKEYRNYSFDKVSVDIINPYLSKIGEILNAVDIHVKELKFKEVLPNLYCLYLIRTHENKENVELQFASESKGTKKIINIAIDVLTNKNTSLFIADDFDAFLHPKLARGIIEMFTSENNTTKQLVFNSHDIINMNNKVFRRDEIWLAYRDEKYTTIYVPLSSLVDYKGKMIRKDAVYGRQYLNGKFGADPFIKQGLKWE